jgi:hypothetical protein
VDGNCCQSRIGFWVVDCGEWTTKRDKPPCELIALAREWLDMRFGIKNQWLGGLSPVCNQLVHQFKDKFFCYVLNVISVVFMSKLNVVEFLDESSLMVLLFLLFHE